MAPFQLTSIIAKPTLLPLCFAGGYGAEALPPRFGMPLVQQDRGEQLL
jgi:hypothetical protein